MFSYCLIFHYYWSYKKNSSLDRGLCYIRLHCNIHYVHISGIFVGIRTFQHLYLSLSVSITDLMRSKLQNAHLYKTALSPRLLRFQTCSEAVVNCWQRCAMKFFLLRFSIKSEDYSSELRFLKTNYIG